MSTLKDDLQALMASASDVKARAAAENAEAQLLAHLVIVETRISAALGEVEPRTPARFRDHRPLNNQPTESACV